MGKTLTVKATQPQIAKNNALNYLFIVYRYFYIDIYIFIGIIKPEIVHHPLEPSMNIQQDARIAKIKKLSRYLYLCLTGIHYLLWVLCPIAIIVIFASSNATFTFMETIKVSGTDITFLQRAMMLTYLALFYFFVLKMSYHFRELIRSFSLGDIFNKKAIEHARKALLNGLALYVIYLMSLFAGWAYFLLNHPTNKIEMNGDFIIGFIFFGLMYILLWALEIGADLNEESELTI